MARVKCLCDLENGYLCRFHRDERRQALRQDFYRGFCYVVGAFVASSVGGLIGLGDAVFLNQTLGYSVSSAIVVASGLSSLMGALILLGTVSITKALFPKEVPETKK